MKYGKSNMNRLQVVVCGVLILTPIIIFSWNIWHDYTNIPTLFENVIIDGSIISNQGSTGSNTIYFPGQSKNRTILINFIAREGVFDCIVFVGKQYSRWIDGKTYHALYEIINSTKVNITVFVPVEESGSHTVRIIRQNLYSNLTLSGRLVARCVAPYWNGAETQGNWSPME
jgi:hypothetical protein